jgi:ABC-type transport system substrate-binding protein
MLKEINRRDLMGLIGGGLALSAMLPKLAGAQEKSGTLKVSTRANPSSLDPMTGLAGDDTPVLWAVYATLLEFEYDSLQPKPGLAEAWEYPDDKTFTLKLRSGLTFHDGTALDAEAVKYNLDRSRSDTRSTIKTDLDSIESVEVEGTDKVIIKLKRPDALLPLALTSRAGMMVSPKASKELGAGLVRKPVGAGPWSFVSWADNASISMKRYDGYWRKGYPKIDAIEFVIIPELNTGLRSVIAGQNHFVYRLSPQQKTVIDRAKSVKPVNGPTLYFHLIYFNNSRPPFNDMRIRQAVSYAIDRDAFNKGTMLGLGEFANSAIPKAHWAYDESLENFFKYDPEKSKALLAAAGHPNGIDIPTIGWNDQYSQQRQELLMEQLAKVGIRLKVDRYSIADASTLYLGPEKRGEAMISAWTGRPDPSMTYNLLTSAGGFFNPSQLQDYPGLTDALVEAQTTLDPEKRKQALFKVQRLVAESAWFCPIVFEPEIDGAAATVEGYRPNLLGWPKFDEVAVAAQ